jgi:transcriptional regulator with XRE-family HTH domain
MRTKPHLNVAMPNINESAKTWELKLAGQLGLAVQARRKALRMTAQQLAERTAELGYPITRVAISKIEGNMRAGKIGVAELLALAAALDIPPVLLLSPGFPDGQVETRPGRSVDAREAVLWFAGHLHAMAGAELVKTHNLMVQTEQRLARMREIVSDPDAGPEEIKSVRADMAYAETVLERLRGDVAREKNELWAGVDFDE